MIPDVAGVLLCVLILLWAVPVLVAIVAEEIRWWRQQAPTGRSWSAVER